MSHNLHDATQKSTQWFRELIGRNHIYVYNNYASHTLVDPIIAFAARRSWPRELHIWLTQSTAHTLACFACLND